MKNQCSKIFVITAIILYMIKIKIFINVYCISKKWKKNKWYCKYKQYNQFIKINFKVNFGINISIVNYQNFSDQIL